MRAFVNRIDKMRSDGRIVFELHGTFAGEEARNKLCYALATASEKEAVELIENTEIRVGLYFDQEGHCKVIDLDP